MFSHYRLWVGRWGKVYLGICKGPDLDHAVEKLHVVPMAGSCEVLCHLVGDLLRDTLRYTTVQVEEEEEVRQKPAKHRDHTLYLLIRSQQNCQQLITHEDTENVKLVPFLDQSSIMDSDKSSRISEE